MMTLINYKPKCFIGRDFLLPQNDFTNRFYQNAEVPVTSLLLNEIPRDKHIPLKSQLPTMLLSCQA